ncbi:MAG: ankyrin repeat domain-containing protein [Acidobacteria bacterium]|nr:ankyrin repeat domain-containing protein [Acidobacteriota bacterium]
MSLFQAAFQALEAGDAGGLRVLLGQQPGLVVEKGKNGNTLLNLAVSLKARPLVEMLLEAGAGVNEGNVHGWTPLHQAAYANECELAAMLLERGADVRLEARGSGGTPLIAALFWGHREVADLLGQHGVAPRNLRAAAGLGSVELVEECLRGDAGGAARGFYRPHSGFPEWQPSADRQEVLDEALIWASKSGRTEVLGRLVEAGARVDADVYRGTALIWAAVGNRVETAEWLIAHGATVDLKATFGGLTHGQGVTALHMAAQHGRMAMVKLLVARGADRKIKDDLHKSDAAGWASFFKQPEVRDYLNGLG